MENGTIVYDMRAADIDELRREVSCLLRFMVEVRHRYAVLVVGGRRNRYVQILIQDEDWLRVETTGDAYLSVAEVEGLSVAEVEGDVYTPEDHAILAHLGWEPPDADDVHVPLNYWQELDLPTDVKAIADLLVDTLVGVHGLWDPRRLRLEMGYASTWPGFPSRN